MLNTKKSLMKKLLIVTTLAFGLLTACSNANTESETSPVAEQETMSADSTVMKPDSTKTAADKMATDSADAAHGHSH